VGGHYFVRSPLLYGKRPASRDDERGIAASNGLLPDRCESAGRPVRPDGALTVVAIPGRPAEIRPVRRGPGGYGPLGRSLLAIRWRLFSGLRCGLFCRRRTARAELCALGLTMPGDDLRPGFCRLDEREMRFAA